MLPTYLMSYPGPTWHIRGGENFRSKDREATNPRAAFNEWLGLCDAITRAGGRILVMPPPSGTTMTGLIYTANSGMLFKTGDDWTFMLSKMSVPHRQAEREHIRAFLREAGLPVIDAQHAWEGQADVTTLKGNRFILTWGVRSVRESLAEVRAHLPMGARVLEAEIREPFFHGDTCLDPVTTRSGDMVLLAHGGALAGAGLPEMRTFLGTYGEVLAVDEDDALHYACNALCVNGTLLAPGGLSASLRGTLVRRGIPVEEVQLPELFGKGGGGPRCLVNELRGFVLTDDAPSYVAKRDQLHALADSYPESAAPPAEKSEKAT
jgi:N-dimethylarginine dimethylaminohydrolase